MTQADGPRLRALVEKEGRRLHAVAPAEAAAVPAAGTWCRKEVLGHLLDSAFNNHQRFVRAQLTAPLSFPGYAQDDWVRCQRYAAEEWQDLVTLWEAVNRHIAWVIEGIPAAALSAPVRIGEGDMVTLAAVVTDYLRHLEHHLAQI